MLNELHTAHAGMVKMKAMAQSAMWWPKMDQEVEKLLIPVTGLQYKEVCCH